MHPSRIGFFGGSFDPVHSGHLRLATVCAEQANLDAVWFVPAAEQPLKPNGPKASASDRVAMLEIALAELTIPAEISRVEIERGGVSYTIDTLRSLQQTHPKAGLFLLLGADSLRDFQDWKEANAICNLATPLVVGRPGLNIDYSVLEPLVSPERFKEIIAEQVVKMDPTPISSSEIRRRIAAGESIEGMIPSGVEDYIRKHGLYGNR